MDNNTYSKQNNSRKGLSAAEFQRDLYNWFESRGFLDDLRTQLRHQMVTALRETKLGESSSKHSNVSVSPKIQAINLLVAEFLLHHDHHYTLSVFTSEVPFLKNMPKFTMSGTQISGRSSSSSDTVPRFQHHDVKDILESFGLPLESEIGSRIYKQYLEDTRAVSLLSCILQNVPERSSSNTTVNVTPSETELPAQTSQSKTNLKDTPSSEKEKENRTIKKMKEAYKAQIQEIVYQSQLKSQHIKQLQEEIRRFQETEIEKIRKEEEAKFHQQLEEKEARIQAEMTHREEAISKKLQEAENRISKQRQALEKEIKLKRQHLSELAIHLQQERQEVDRKLHEVEEHAEQLKNEEKRIDGIKQKDSIELAERTSVLDVRQQQLQQEFERLNVERETMNFVQMELEDSRRQLMQARQSLAHSQSELSFLRNIQQQCSHLRYELDATRLKLDNLTEREIQRSSVSIAIQPRSTETVDKGLQTVSPQPAKIVPAPPLPQSPPPPEPERESHNIPVQSKNTNSGSQNTEQQQQDELELLNKMLRHIQRENEELRGHTQQQRLRIDELTTHATELANQLEDAHTAITLLSSRPREVGTSDPRLLQPVFLPPGAGTITVPPLIAPPPPPPPPPPFPPQGPRHATQSRQLGAGEELNYVTPPPTSQPPPLSFGSSSSHSNNSHRREWRKKPPRRLMVHSNSNSSDETSPTEEILQEARRRLRKLEEESEAVDRSYQNFRRRHESVGATASLLFHPILPPSHLQYPSSSLGFGSFTSSRPFYSPATGGTQTPIIFSNFNYDNSPATSQHSAIFNPLLPHTTSRLFPPLYHGERIQSSVQFSTSSGLHYSFPPRTQTSVTLGNLSNAFPGRTSTQTRYHGINSGLISQSRFTTDPTESRFTVPPPPSTSLGQPNSRPLQAKGKIDCSRRNSSSQMHMFDPYNVSSAETYNQHQMKTVTFGSPLKTTMVYTSPQISSSVESPGKRSDSNGAVTTVQSYTSGRPRTSTVQSPARIENWNGSISEEINTSQVPDLSNNTAQPENTDADVRRLSNREEVNQEDGMPRRLSTDNIWQLRQKLSSYFTPELEQETPVKGSVDKDTTISFRSGESSSIQKLFPSCDTSKSHTTVSDEPHPSGSFLLSETTESSNEFGARLNIPICSISGTTFSSSIKDTFESSSVEIQPSVEINQNSQARDKIPIQEEEITSEKSGLASHTQLTVRNNPEVYASNTLGNLENQANLCQENEVTQNTARDGDVEKEEHSSQQILQQGDNSDKLLSLCLQNNSESEIQMEPSKLDKSKSQTVSEEKEHTTSTAHVNQSLPYIESEKNVLYEDKSLSEKSKDRSEPSAEDESDVPISVGDHSKKDDSSKDDFW